MTEDIAIIPAAGKGTRAFSLTNGSPKELVRIPFRNRGAKDTINIKTIFEFSIDLVVCAGITKAHVILSEGKFEIINFLQDGKRFALNLTYAYQMNTRGLPFAVDSVYSFIKGKCVSVVLPDTIVYPRHALRDMLSFFHCRNDDVILGIFPTSSPKQLCQVIYDQNLSVIRLYDKDRQVFVHNTWGIAAWRSRFTNFIHDYIKDKERDITLSEIFNEAINSRIKVAAFPLGGFTYLDTGTPEGLKDALLFSCNIEGNERTIHPKFLMDKAYIRTNSGQT